MSRDRKSVLHICKDAKFIKAAFDIFEEAFPNKNRFVVLLQDNKSKEKYEAEGQSYTYIHLYNDDYISQIDKLVSHSDIIVFHGLNPHQAEISLSIKNTPKLWIIFGAEIYNNPIIMDDTIYGSITNNNYIKTLKNILKKIVRPYHYQFFKGVKKPFEKIRSAIKKMDYVGVLYEEEFRFCQQLQILSSTSEFLKFSYYPLDVVIENDEKTVSSNNILIGNSATYSNNHREIFEILNTLKIKNSELVTPLSYGKSGYAQDIIKIGKELFGDNFTPLTEFLPLKEYQKVLQNCGIVIMNHYRQQAVGNVLNTLYMGAKVYLSKKNTLYHYLKRIGCYIYAVEDDLKPENRQALDLLDQNKINENRKILRNELNVDSITKELRAKLSPILN